MPVWSSSSILSSVCWSCPSPTDKPAGNPWIKRKTHAHIIYERTDQSPFDARCPMWRYSLKAILQCRVDLIHSLWLRDFGRWVGFGRYGKHPAGSAGLPTKTWSAQRWEVPATEGSSGPQNNQTISVFFSPFCTFSLTLSSQKCLDNLPYNAIYL